jgi:hypothetical protein
MDPICSPTPPWKDILEAAGHVAEVAIALIAVWPMLNKAVGLIRTEPPQSDDERAERIQLLVSGRMGWGQRCWTLFLEWARREPSQLLSWRETQARFFLCPMGGHKIGEIGPAGSRFFADCLDCQARKHARTEDEIRRWAADGVTDPFGTDSKTRKRVDPSATLISEAATKLADELARIVDPSGR